MKPKSKILIIAGSDSSGGAGIQADIKTSLGSYAMTAITAITSQNTTGIKSIVSIDAKEISNQIEFTAKAPFVSKLILAQLKAAITLGFSKLAKSVAP